MSPAERKQVFIGQETTKLSSRDEMNVSCESRVQQEEEGESPATVKMTRSSTGCTF